jgi:hypothetical protein
MRQGQACGNPLSNLDSWLWQSAVRPFSLWQSATVRGKHLSAKSEIQPHQVYIHLFAALNLLDA